MKFERFDINDTETYPGNEMIREKWYGKKEVPNIKLTLYNKYYPEFQAETEKRTIYFDILKDYYEEYDSEKGWKVVLALSLLSPKVYEIITDQQYKVYYTQANNLWRNSNTGKDEGFIEPTLRFNRLSIKHKLSEEGDPAIWYITLWNDKESCFIPPVKNEVILEEVKL